MNVDDKVKFVRTGDRTLDGRTGIILGTSFKFPNSNSYIVLFDEPFPDYPDKACSITEHCLEKI